METLVVSKFCQSCGMPMKKDPNHGGINKDGSKNSNFCSYCYVDGEFSFKGTAKEMQTFCVTKMKEMGSSSFVAWLLTRNIPRLARWRKK